MSCKYKDILGKPNTGVHFLRLFDIAIFDVLLTVLLGYVIHLLTKVNLYIILVSVFVWGIIVHRLFCVKTKVDRILFGENKIK